MGSDDSGNISAVNQMNRRKRFRSIAWSVSTIPVLMTTHPNSSRVPFKNILRLCNLITDFFLLTGLRARVGVANGMQKRQGQQTWEAKCNDEMHMDLRKGRVQATIPMPFSVICPFSPYDLLWALCGMCRRSPWQRTLLALPKRRRLGIFHFTRHYMMYDVVWRGIFSHVRTVESKRYRSFSWSLIVISSGLVPSVRCISSRVFGLILHFFLRPARFVQKSWVSIANPQLETGCNRLKTSIFQQIWEQIQAFQRSISWSIPDSLHRSLGCIHHLAVQLEPLGSQDSHIRGRSNFQRIDRSDWKLKTCWPLEDFGKGG